MAAARSTSDPRLLDAPLFVTIVLDGVGIGSQPDSDRYGDEHADTLAHVCENRSLNLPHLARLGLGNIKPLRGIPAQLRPLADYGRMTEVSAGKDSTTGHWELAGIVLDQPFPTYPEGFPADLTTTFLEKTRAAGWLGGSPASGTEIIEALGKAHQRLGYPIIYTSADSVFQIATHTDVVSLEQLYDWCQITRDHVCTGPHGVGRVIARPFHGPPGAYERLSAKRRDFSLSPATPPVQQTLQHFGVRTVAIGKIADLFAGVGFDESHKTTSNAEGINSLLNRINAYRTHPEPTFIWINLVDFDQEFGHRNNPVGFGTALEEFDSALPDLLAALPKQRSRLVVTADHGNDPTTPGTDHTREYVPLLVVNPEQAVGVDLGILPSFVYHANLVKSFFTGLPA